MKILFTYKNYLAHFIKEDINILNKIGIVDVYEFGNIKKITDFWLFLKQLLNLIVFPHRVYYCFFVDYHALLPVLWAKLLRKKSIVIVAGYDAFGFQDRYMKYGIFTSHKWRVWMAKVIYKYVDHILTVSESLQQSLMEQGIKVDKRFKTVYFGWDPSAYTIHKKQSFCLTVGIANDLPGFYRKGYDRFIKLAEMNPQYKFVAIGLNIPLPKGFEQPNNLTLFKQRSQYEVKCEMAKAKIFLQLSRAEGMPNTLAEAILNGCFTLTSNVNGIPDLNPINCWDFNDPDVFTQISYAIEDIMVWGDEREVNNRNRVIGLFSIKNREVQLRSLILGINK